MATSTHRELGYSLHFMLQLAFDAPDWSWLLGIPPTPFPQCRQTAEVAALAFKSTRNSEKVRQLRGSDSDVAVGVRS